MRGEGWSQGPKPDPYDFGRPSYSVVSRIPPNLAKNPFPKSDRLLGLPAAVPQSEVIVGTRKKINKVRKPLEK
jgi:hypothetical protein